MQEVVAGPGHLEVLAVEDGRLDASD